MYSMNNHVCPTNEFGNCGCGDCDTDVSEYGNVDCKTCRRSCFGGTV